jgi:hypothetical protein
VAGSARSGTSWLAEIIAQQFRYRLLFEPEHEFQTKKGYLICDKLITKSNISKEQENYFVQIFKNKVDCDWIAQISNRKFKMHLWPFLPKMYIIKFVRGNLSTPFINSFFKIPVLFIIRNPYDVIASQARVKFPWLYDLNHFKNQVKLNAFLEKEYDFFWSDLEKYTDHQVLTIRWCIENKVIFDLHDITNSSFRILEYEDLKNNLDLFLNISSEFNLKPLDDISKVYSKPSSKTHPKSNIRGNDNNDNLSPLEKSEINVILKKFKISRYPLQQ